MESLATKYRDGLPQPFNFWDERKPATTTRCTRGAWLLLLRLTLCRRLRAGNSLLSVMLFDRAAPLLQS